MGDNCLRHASDLHRYTGEVVPNPSGSAHRGGRRNLWPWVNWGLAPAPVPAAAIVMPFALGAVMSADGCSDSGRPAAFVVPVVSFVTAKRRGGMVVPGGGWVLPVADVVWMAAAVSGRRVSEVARSRRFRPAGPVPVVATKRVALAARMRLRVRSGPGPSGSSAWPDGA